MGELHTVFAEMTGGFKMQPPEAFNGDHEKFEDFAFKFKAYMNLESSEYDRLFNFAEVNDQPITDDDFTVDGVVNQMNVDLSKKLNFMLIQVLQGPPMNLIKQTRNMHGFENWRILHQHYGKAPATSSVGRLLNILTYSFKESELEADFIQFETEVCRYESSTSTTLPDELKTAIVMMKTSGDLQRHLQLQASSLTAFSQTKSTVLNYVRSRRSFTSTSSTPSSPTPMELSLIHISEPTRRS